MLQTDSDDVTGKHDWHFTASKPHVLGVLGRQALKETKRERQRERERERETKRECEQAVSKPQ